MWGDRSVSVYQSEREGVEFDSGVMGPALLLLLLVVSVDLAKILVYSPSISASHVLSNARIADTLAKAGHDVVQLILEYDTTISDYSPAKLAKVIRMNNISEAYMRDNDDWTSALFAMPRLSFNIRIAFEYTLSEMCEAVIQRREDLQKLRDYKFDVAFAEQVDVCGIGIVRAIGIENLLWVSTTPLMDANSYNLGVPAPPSYVPTIEENDNSDIMSFWDRAFNLYMYIGAIYIHRLGSDMSTAAIRRHFDPNFPHIRDIAANSSLCFVNADEMFDLPRPTTHKTIYIGGLGLKEPQPLPQNFAKIMEKGEKGVIVFSLGSIVPFSELREPMKMGVAEVFRKMSDYHFILKINKDDDVSAKYFEAISNVDIVHWMPQIDILAHPRIKLFVMHGGLNGMTEALHAGVPMLVIPIFADQFRNGRNAERRGVGVVLPKLTLGEHTLYNAMQTILNNESYKKNALRMQKLMKEKPFSAEERLVRWTEFAANNGVLDNLHIQGSRLSTVVYFNLDVIAVAIASVIISLYLVYKILSFTFSTKRVQKIKRS